MNTDKIYAEAIAKEYAPKDNSKLIALKKLDNRAKLPAIIFTYTFGVMSSLVLGFGMCLAMQVMGGGVISVGVDEVYQRLYQHILDPILERFHYPVADRNYVIRFYLTGINAIVTQWLKDGCQKSVEEISRIIHACIFGLNQNLPQSEQYNEKDKFSKNS